MRKLETALSAALTACLRAPEAERHAYAALHLLTNTMPDRYEIDLPQFVAPPAAPPNLDAAVARLSEEIKGAVNSAVRRKACNTQQAIDGPTSPMLCIYEAIADYLLLLHGGQGLPSLNADDDETYDEACSRDPRVSFVEDGESKQGANLPSNLARQGTSPKQKLRRLIAGRPRKIVYARLVLGRTASEIMPTVLGAFQDEAAKRAAREVDYDVVEQAMIEGEKVARQASRMLKDIVKEEEDLALQESGLPKGIRSGMA